MGFLLVFFGVRFVTEQTLYVTGPFLLSCSFLTVTVNFKTDVSLSPADACSEVEAWLGGSKSIAGNSYNTVEMVNGTWH